MRERTWARVLNGPGHVAQIARPSGTKEIKTAQDGSKGGTIMDGFVDTAFEAMQYGYHLATGNIFTTILCIAIYGIFLVRDRDGSGRREPPSGPGPPAAGDR